MKIFNQLFLLAAISSLLITNASAVQVVSLFGTDPYDLDSTSYVYCNSADVPSEMLVCVDGTEAGDGWVTLDSAYRTVQIDVTQLVAAGATGINYQVEGRLGNPSTTLTAVVIEAEAEVGVGTVIVEIPENVWQIRVGIKHEGADDGDDLTTNAEEVLVVLQTFGWR